MSEAYERIWLQCPNTDPENEWCGETTWCQDKINDGDVEYVRGDLVESLRQRVKELEEKCRGHAQIEVALRNELAVLKAAALSDDGASGEGMQLVIDNQALRQRVKELETDLRESLLQERAECDRADAALKQESNGYRFSAENNYKLYTDLLAELNKLKAGQGEPVGYVRTYVMEALQNGYGTTKINKYPQAEDDIALYTSTPTIPEGWVMVQDKAICYLFIDNDGNYQVDRCDHPSEMLIPVFKKAAPKPEE